MVSSRSGPPSLLWAMIGHSTEEFHMTSDIEGGGIKLPSPRRHGMGASPAPTTTISWLENALTTQAMAMIPLWPDTDIPFER
jgi:hypothetical protein